MENITFQIHKNIFMKINDQSGPRPTYKGHDLRTRAKACVRRHISTYTTKVLEA